VVREIIATQIIAAIRLRGARDPARVLEAALWSIRNLSHRTAPPPSIWRDATRLLLPDRTGAGLAAVVSNILAQRGCQFHLLQVARQLQEQVGEGQLALRNFFIRRNSRELTIMRGATCKIRGIWHWYPYFFYMARSSIVILFICGQHTYPDALCRRWKRPRRAGVRTAAAAGATARTIGLQEMGRGLRSAGAKNAPTSKAIGACYAHQEWRRAQTV
jgi:hypothetical protein